MVLAQHFCTGEYGGWEIAQQSLIPAVDLLDSLTGRVGCY
jgi:hypothetical protein